MKIFKENFIKENSKKLTTYIVICVSIFLVSAGLMVMFGFLTNDNNYILFIILSCLVSILGGSSIIFIIFEKIRQTYKDNYFYRIITASSPSTVKGRIVGGGKRITLQKGIKAIEYELLAEEKRIMVYFNIEISEDTFSIDEKGLFTIQNNFIVAYEKEE